MYGVGRFRSIAKMLPLGAPVGAANTGTPGAMVPTTPTVEIGAGPELRKIAHLNHRQPLIGSDGASTARCGGRCAESHAARFETLVLRKEAFGEAVPAEAGLIDLGR